MHAQIPEVRVFNSGTCGTRAAFSTGTALARNSAHAESRRRGERGWRVGGAQMPRDIDEITGAIVDAAVKLHSGLGPGLLESVYEVVLARELERRGFRVE